MDGDCISESKPESRWTTAVLSANQAVWDHDFEHNQHYLSETWRTLRGLRAGDEIPLTTDEWLTTIHENDLTHVFAEWQRINAGETDIIDYKFRQKHRDGHWVWFLSRGRVVRRDSRGRPVRIVGTDTDITDIKTVEAESQRMNQRLSVAMEAAGMGRWELDPETGEAYWDDRLLRLLGIRDGQNKRVGTEWLQYVHPGDRDDVYPYLTFRVENRLDIERDYRLLNAEGETLWIRALAKFVCDTETGPRYYGVNVDVTRDKIQTEELENARALLEYESRHDALTKLANRRKLDEVFSELVGHSRDGMSVMHFDIDHFKQINDTLGHDAGDATLQHAAAILQRHIRGETLVSRVGGDEFVALFFERMAKPELQNIAEAIIWEMAQPFQYKSQKCAIGTSIGIATSENYNSGISSLFINADLALYDAKKAGRGRFRFYDPSMKEEALYRKLTFDALSAGLERGEITCHYQPQFDSRTLELSGFEALVRWEREGIGLTMPDQFLGIAEEMGVLSEVDNLVLRRVLRDIEFWEDKGAKIPPISINVSASRLNDPNFANQLLAFDIPTGSVSFELLESAFLDAKNEVVERNLCAVYDLGINIEIDDFGSGHASIASLLAVSPTRLKIDRSLVGPITTSERQRKLVYNVIGIGHMLGIKVVAEGVESAAHIKILQDMRCDFLQGFGLCRPMDANASLQYLEADRKAVIAFKQA